jgi:hypothetical protein
MRVPYNHNLKKIHMKKKINFLTVALLFLCSASVKSQEGVNLLYNAIPGFDEECFFIGTLDDYMGHQQTFTLYVINDSTYNNFSEQAKQVVTAKVDSFYYQMADIYTQGEKSLALFLDSLLIVDYPDLRFTNNNASNYTLPL